MTTIAIVKLSERANRVVNIVKARYGLRDKSAALNQLIQEYEDDNLEPELRPEYIKKLKCIEKEKTIKVKNINELFDNLRKR
jgi:hypothetical protein